MIEVDVSELVEQLRAGDRVALGRAVTLVESTRSDHRDAAAALLDACLPYTGASLRIGITGVPGVGKSTFINSLGTKLIASEQRRVAVLAVDPSSRLSGGSILGDKTRMPDLASSDDAFIRPSPSGATLGGVARHTREVIFLCEAAGYDTIFVETVGVGQAETAVHALVDYFLLLALAGAGDELQGIKRGIVEMADGLAITKADGKNVEAARRACQQFTQALRLLPPTDSGWRPTVRTCSAVDGTGLEAVWNDVTQFVGVARESGYFTARRREQSRHWLREALDERLLELLHDDASIAEMLRTLEEQVVRSEISASVAADQVLDAFKRSTGR